MTLADLTTYALEKYSIPEEHKWEKFPGFSVLCHPVSKKWLALLIRKQDGTTGATIEKCDLRCGRVFLKRQKYDFLTEPTREKGDDWLGIDFDEHTDSKIVLALFDFAYQQNTPSINSGYTLTLDSQQPDNQKVFTDTPINFANRQPQPSNNANAVPHKIREMQQLYEYDTWGSWENRNRNFYKQGKFMENYEDNVPYVIDSRRYYPTYHDLNVTELRAYFSWRTKIRKGIFEKNSICVAYMYIYELLNCIGATSAVEALEKLTNFANNYLNHFGTENMKKNFKCWIFDFAIVNKLPNNIALQYADDNILRYDTATNIMLNDQQHNDDEILSALGLMSKKSLDKSPVIKKLGDKGKTYFTGMWRYLKNQLAYMFFGEKQIVRWFPLSNAIYYSIEGKEDFNYEFFPNLKYTLRNGTWYIEHYNLSYYNKRLINNFVNAVDLKLRQHFHTGSPLKESEAYHQFYPLIDRAIKQLDEEFRPKIEVNLSSLSQIRSDSVTTRDSLLTDEDKDWSADGSSANNLGAGIPARPSETPTVETRLIASLPPSPDTRAGMPALHTQILRAILSTGDASAIIKANHLMPTVIAEQINEAYYDQFADNIVDCDGETITIVEDYREELEEMLDYNF